MPGNGSKSLLIEAWAFVAVAVIAFVGGLLIGDLGGSPKTETVSVATSANEGAEAESPEPVGEATETEEGAGGTGSEQKGTANNPGAEVFTAAGCGTCHVLAAAGSTGETGPNLNEIPRPR